MFKCIGMVFIVFSSFIVFNYKILNDYKTYLLLKDTIRVIKEMLHYIPMGKTYPEIINDTETIFYKNFRSENINNFLSDLSIEKNIKNDIKIFFTNLGKKDINSEKQYMLFYVEYFERKSAEIKENYDKNSKANFIAGFSVGLIICIVII